jgi:hypothetical protein
MLLKKPHPLRTSGVCPEFIEGTNGGVVESRGRFPFMLSQSKHIFRSFSAESSNANYPSGREYFSRSLAKRCPLSRAAWAKFSGMTL